MTPAVSALTSQSRRMSPVAFALALSLHALTPATLWWVSPLRPPEPPQDAIMVTVDAGAPPTSPESPPEDKPTPPVATGTPEPTPVEPPREEAPQADAPPQAEQPVEPSQQPPQRSLEQALAPPEEVPPPDARNFPRPAPPPARPPPPPRPPQGALSQAPLPRPPPAPPPANAPASVPAPPSNSSDWLLGKGRARNAYLDQVARLTSRHRTYPRVSFDNKQEGRVVTRVTIARDGRLIDVRIDKSSGWPAIDAAELEAIRRSAPFPPVPADMPGDPLILILPINYDLTFPRSR